MEQLPQVSPTKDECNLAMLAHLLGIFTGFLGALVIWLIKRDDSAYVAEQAREALNFQITMAIALFASGMLTLILIGLLAIPVLLVANLIFCLMGAIAASKGHPYRYPFAWRLVR
ncbi:MAG TPA: DUF4870 domain-containing protein [Burkholderiaceae bacterium]|jgi:hypothetical protein|nr:DUF4870 domain-containing protein [Burkholderiaceae bacterium]